MARVLVALALLVPGLAVAQQPSAAPATAPAVAPAQAPSTAPAAAPATTAPAGAPSTAAPAGTPVAPVAVAVAAPKKEYGSYFVLKGGWFGSSSDYEGDSFSGSTEWELAAGTGRILGIEIAGGYMETSASGIEVQTIPLLLTVRLQIPIAFVAPHLDAGAGVYFNDATVAGKDVSDTTLGWHVGLGCDVLLGRAIVGADFRYMGISPTFATVGSVTLDRYAVLLKAGVRF